MTLLAYESIIDFLQSTSKHSLKAADSEATFWHMRSRKVAIARPTATTTTTTYATVLQGMHMRTTRKWLDKHLACKFLP